jgi:hypothetical protein
MFRIFLSSQSRKANWQTVIMAKKAVNKTQDEGQPETLKGWKAIAAFLGEPMSVAQRWESEGMPVSRAGRTVTSTPQQLNAWLGRVSDKPVHIVTPETDLATELKRGIAFARQSKKAAG